MNDGEAPGQSSSVDKCSLGKQAFESPVLCFTCTLRQGPSVCSDTAVAVQAGAVVTRHGDTGSRGILKLGKKIRSNEVNSIFIPLYNTWIYG